MDDRRPQRTTSPARRVRRAGPGESIDRTRRRMSGCPPVRAGNRRWSSPRLALVCAPGRWPGHQAARPDRPASSTRAVGDAPRPGGDGITEPLGGAPEHHRADDAPAGPDGQAGGISVSVAEPAHRCRGRGGRPGSDMCCGVVHPGLPGCRVVGARHSRVVVRPRGRGRCGRSGPLPRGWSGGPDGRRTWSTSPAASRAAGVWSSRSTLGWWPSLSG